MSSPLEESYRHCERTARTADSSFAWSIRILPRAKRRAMCALYAFSRHTDDLSDCDRDGEQRRAALGQWRDTLRSAVEHGSHDRMLPAVLDTVRAFGIPIRYLFDLIDGVEMDTKACRYETFAEVSEYCYRVAGVVGLACVHIWGFTSTEFQPLAVQCGLAFQLTNILRDLKEDAARQRIYLPLEDLRRFHCEEADLLAGVRDERLAKLVRFEVARAEQLYAEAEPLCGLLHPDGRRAFRMMFATYRALLREIKRRDGDVFSRKVRLTRAQKLRLLVPELPALVWGSRDRERSKAGAGGSCQVSMLGQGDRAAAVCERPTVGIVGGGLAGLAAAAVLCERGIRVDLFEARRQLGGRAGSFVDPLSGELVDHCQHVAMGCCTNLLDFFRRTGIDGLLERHTVLHFFGPDGRRYDVRGSTFPAPLHLGPSLLRLGFLTFRERLGIARGVLQLCRTHPSDVNDATMGAWLRSSGQSERAIRRFWAVILVSALGESIERVSRSAARQVFVDGFVAARTACDLYVPRIPLGELYGQRVAKWLSDRSLEMHLGSPVAKVSGDRTCASGIVLEDGTPCAFDWVILAVPWRRVEALTPTDMLRAVPHLDVAKDLQPAAITGVHLWFDRPWMNVPHAVLIDRLSQWVFRRCCEPQPASEAAEHYVQVVISGSHDLAGRSRDSILAEVLSDLHAIWPASRPAILRRWRVVTEHDAVFSSQPNTDLLRPNQITPVPGLLLAGDWTQTGWPATMEGAVRSGYVAAETILRATGDARPVVQPELPRGWLARRLLPNAD